MTNTNLTFYKKASLALCGVVIACVFFELVLQIGVRIKLIPYYSPLDNAYYSYNPAPYFSKPCCHRDSISGFRWMDDSAVSLKICRGAIVFHQAIKPNKAGFISPCEFEPHKKDTSVFRWLIFGDSFTDGYFLSRNWPTQVNDILKGQNKRIELHSFALNGSGIKTWARELEWLNKMNYEYDGVIIACFGNDLAREDFIMEHSGENCYFGWTDLDKNNRDTVLQKEKTILDPGSNANIRDILSGKYANCGFRLFLPYYLHILYKEIRQLVTLKFQTQELFDKYIFANNNDRKTDSVIMMNKYGPDKMSAMVKMLTGCNQRSKKIMLVSIPDSKGLETSKTYNDIQLNIELKWIASQYKAVVEDGYGFMDNKNPGQQFLKYDGHWNQYGSDRFAAQISKVIIKESKIGQ